MWCCVTARQRLQNRYCLCNLESREMRPSPSDMKTLRFYRVLNTTSYTSVHSIIDEFDTCKHKRQTYMHICIQRQASFLQSRFWVPCRDFRLFQSLTIAYVVHVMPRMACGYAMPEVTCANCAQYCARSCGNTSERNVKSGMQKQQENNKCKPATAGPFLHCCFWMPFSECLDTFSEKERHAKQHSLRASCSKHPSELQFWASAPH